MNRLLTQCCSVLATPKHPNGKKHRPKTTNRTWSRPSQWWNIWTVVALPINRQLTGYSKVNLFTGASKHQHCRRETQGSRQWTDNLGDQSVQIGVGGTLNVQVPATNIVKSFVVVHDCHVGVLQQWMHTQHLDWRVLHSKVRHTSTNKCK